MGKTWFTPNWPTPNNVKSLVTTRLGGCSLDDYASFNLGGHVGDNAQHVESNRRLLYSSLPEEVTWLNQVHGTEVMTFETEDDGCVTPTADGVFTRLPKRVCAVMTADCLPILICDKYGREVAALHAGWRSLSDGVIVEGVRRFIAQSSDLMAYLGPAISQPYFEVGGEVLEHFRQQWFARAKKTNTNTSQVNYGEAIHYQHSIEDFFQSVNGRQGKFLADLKGIAKAELNALGVQQIFDDGWCTWANNDQFYSHRKEQPTGRFASLIWLE